MSTQLQIRRDTAANIALSTPVAGEIWYDTTNKRLNVGDGSNVGGIEVPNYIDIQNGSFDYALATGTANALVITTSPSNPSAYVSGQRVRVKIATTNTSSATINWGSLGVKTIRKWSNGALVDLSGSELIAGMIVDLFYDGTYFQLQGASTQSSAYTLITSTTISSQATVDFDNSVITGYSNYMFVFTAIKPATDNAQFLVRFSVDGGASYSSATTYITFGRLTTNTGTGADIGGAATTAGLLTQAGNGIGTGTNEAGLNGKMILENPASTGYKSADMTVNYTNGTPTFIHFDGAVFMNTSPFTGTDIDGVRFLMSSGNIASGIISVFGFN